MAYGRKKTFFHGLALVLLAMGGLAVIVLLFSLQLFSRPNLQTELKNYFSTIYKGQPYREPTDSESRAFLEDFQKIINGDTSHMTQLSKLGYSAQDGIDEVSGKQYILLLNEAGTDRAWGAYLVPVGQPIHYVISAPHPKADINTETIARDLWRKTPNAMLMIAGAHRTSTNNLADVAHQADSLFAKVSDYLASRGAKHIQLHGFDDTTAPGKDIVVSSGQAAVDSFTKHIADSLETKSFNVARAWDKDTTVLLANTNVEGQSARRHNSSFVHIEMSNSTRTSDTQAERVIDTIARQLQ